MAQADAAHSLANFKLEGGDSSKLYKLDGAEYDAKGIRELISKLRTSKADGAQGEGENPEQLLHTLLVAVRPR